MTEIDLVIHLTPIDEKAAARQNAIFATMDLSNGWVIAPQINQAEPQPRHTLRLVLATLTTHYTYDYTSWAGADKFQTTPYPAFADLPRTMRRMMVFGLLASRQRGFMLPQALEVGDQDFGVHYATRKSLG